MEAPPPPLPRSDVGGAGPSKAKAAKAKAPRQGSVDSFATGAAPANPKPKKPRASRGGKGEGSSTRGGGGAGGGRGRGGGGKKGRKRSVTREASLATGGRGSVAPQADHEEGGQAYGGQDGSGGQYPAGGRGGNEDEEEEYEDEEAEGGAAGGEEGGEDEAEGDEEGLLEEDEWIRQEAVQKARQANIGPLVDAMTEDQRERFFAYRSQKLEKRHVRRLVNHLTSQSVTDSVATLAAGAAKIFVGDIVERARAVQQQREHTGPIRPEHLLEAHRLYRQEREKPGRLPPGAPNASAGVAGSGKRRRMF